MPYGKMKIAVVGASVAEFMERLKELGKIFSIRVTNFGVAELTGGNVPIECIYIHNPEMLRGHEFDGYIALQYANRHPDFEPIMEELPKRIRKHTVH